MPGGFSGIPVKLQEVGDLWLTYSKESMWNIPELVVNE